LILARRVNGGYLRQRQQLRGQGDGIHGEGFLPLVLERHRHLELLADRRMVGQLYLNGQALRAVPAQRQQGESPARDQHAQPHHGDHAAHDPGRF